MDDWALDYIRKILAERNVSPSELARLSGVSSTTLTRPLNPVGSHSYAISRKTLEKIRDATGIPFPGEVIPKPSAAPDWHEDSIRLPILDGDKRGTMMFDANFLEEITASGDVKLGIVQIHGDSMEPTLQDGDRALVDLGNKSLAQDGLYAIRYGGTAQVKRIGRHRLTDWVTILSDNHQYSSIESPAADVDVMGRVIWYGRKA